jgi:hypothetical protein
MQPHNFTATIDVNGHPTEFEFTTMNIKELKLFQVYFTWNNEKAKRRFHMMRENGIDFKITDRSKLPQGANLSEHQLADAILREHGEIG